MGEHADELIEREIRSTGQRMAREHMREEHNRSEAARRAAGREECARNLAVHEAREKALAAVVEAGAASKLLLEVKLELRREGKTVQAYRVGTPSRIGIWYPGDRPPVVGDRRVKPGSVDEWFAALAGHEHRVALGIERSEREAVRRAR